MQAVPRHDHVKGVFQGGRCLQAVLECAELAPPEKLILIVLASDMDFRGDFSEARWFKQSRFMRLTSMPRATFQRWVARLVERGYLKVEASFAGNGRQLCNSYQLTTRIFDEYSAKLAAQPALKIVKPSSSENGPLGAPATPASPPQSGAPKAPSPSDGSLPGIRSFGAGQKEESRARGSERGEAFPQRLYIEAERIASYIFAPPVSGREFFWIKSVDGFGHDLLRNFGIETMRLVADECARGGLPGSLAFTPHNLQWVRGRAEGIWREKSLQKPGKGAKTEPSENES